MAHFFSWADTILAWVEESTGENQTNAPNVLNDFKFYNSPILPARMTI